MEKRTSSLDAKLISDLIAIGNCDDEALNSGQAFQPYSYIADRDEINRLYWTEWNAVTDQLKEDEIVALIRALAVIEERLHWLGGSVSAVIWVFRALERTHPRRSNEVARWVIEHDQNPYAPFGSLQRRSGFETNWRKEMSF